MEVGWVRWIAEAGIAMWKVGDNTAWVNDELLKEYGGWPFVPDLAWANVQAFAAYHLKARQTAALDRGSSVLASVAAFLAPAVSAQDGCTGLHWLDGSVFRVCCDAHDRCYYKYGCSSSSWYWPFGNAWQCTACNMGAVNCFAYGGEFPYPYSQLP